MAGMNWMDRTVLRHTVAALVMLMLCLAGMARGLANTTDGAAPAIVIGGVAISICHTDDGSGDRPGTPVHDCCDLCTLHAQVILPPVHALALRLPIIHIQAPPPGHGPGTRPAPAAHAAPRARPAGHRYPFLITRPSDLFHQPRQSVAPCAPRRGHDRISP
jgi:hypothetical protein